MKGKLVYWHKARLRKRYILETEIFQVGKFQSYPDGLRYGLICFDAKTGRRVLMDNHHPKGHHIHLNEKEMPYSFENVDTLIEDFKALVLENLGVKI